MTQARPFRPAPAPDPTAKPGPLQALVLRLLNEHGLSQGQIDRKIGVPQSRVSRYARGKVPPALDDVFKLQELEQQLIDAKKASQDLAATQTPPAQGPGR